MLACLVQENMYKGLGRSQRFLEVLAQHTCTAAAFLMLLYHALWGGATGGSAGRSAGGSAGRSGAGSGEGPPEGLAQGSGMRSTGVSRGVSRGLIRGVSRGISRGISRGKGPTDSCHRLACFERMMTHLKVGGKVMRPSIQPLKARLSRTMVTSSSPSTSLSSLASLIRLRACIPLMTLHMRGQSGQIGSVGAEDRWGRTQGLVGPFHVSLQDIHLFPGLYSHRVFWGHMSVLVTMQWRPRCWC